MTKLLTTTAVLALLVAAPAWAQTSPRPNTGASSSPAAQAQAINGQDRSFATEAAIGGKVEVDLGKLAASRGRDPSVKEFGKRMVEDHGKANDKLAAVAKELKLTLPSAVDQKHKELEERLSKLSGDEFDRAYVAEMVKDHREDVAAFQKEIASGSHAQIKSFASETLPIVQQHLKMAQEMETKLKPALTIAVPGAARSGSSGAMPGASQSGTGR